MSPFTAAGPARLAAEASEIATARMNPRGLSLWRARERLRKRIQVIDQAVDFRRVENAVAPERRHDGVGIRTRRVDENRAQRRLPQLAHARSLETGAQVGARLGAGALGNLVAGDAVALVGPDEQLQSPRALPQQGE